MKGLRSRPPEHSLVVTTLEAAQALRVSTRHIERMVQRGELRAVGRGRARRIVWQSVLDYVNRGGDGG